MPESESRAPTEMDSRGYRTHPLSSLIQGAILAGVAALAVFGGTMRNSDNVLFMALAIAGAMVIGFMAGVVRWWFTRYIIDASEIRVHTGAIFKSARRIPFERLQSVDISEPIAARLFGLAELRLEVAGGDESRTGLKYLPLADARSLRRMLLERAHGRHADFDVSSAGRLEDDFADRQPQAIDGSAICRVTPDRIMGAAFLSLDFAGLTLGLIAFFVFGFAMGEIGSAFAIVVPFVLAWVQFVSRRVISQWDFQLFHTERGLRIQRGLLTRSSQTLPFDRIQGVASVEPLVWRQLGWRRLDVDVAGYADASDNGSAKPSTTLLPVADHNLMTDVIGHVMPGAYEPDADHMRVPRRSWWFAPIGWRFRWLRVGPAVVSVGTGWITRRVSIVPHHKTQSVAVRQGPLQRVRGVATLDVHTPNGPVHARVRHLDAPVARRQAMAQLTRARQARN